MKYIKEILLLTIVFSFPCLYSVNADYHTDGNVDNAIGHLIILLSGFVVAVVIVGIRYRYSTVSSYAEHSVAHKCVYNIGITITCLIWLFIYMRNVSTIGSETVGINFSNMVFFTISVVVIIVAIIVSVLFFSIQNYRKHNTAKVEKPAKVAVPNEDKKKSPFEKYCNDKKNDNYQIRAKWILLHDKNERDDRGQDDSM
ncbi:hypothetical protein [Aminicella lysinilytica]|jgi:predicted small integral membrane protein|uniref:hypothetical protein n=1 Tax=Aminicella lysinilytica TaxID=433323 RepID=UPI0017EC7234|nr:hypothetical protein [Aminicella lysinilytica]NLD10686.1 hypothetical protein [Clostridiales bacterium]